MNQPVLAGLTLSQQIRDALSAQIIAGDLPGGERLIETALAAAFGTSQAPVREALRELETLGLVEIRPRRGTFVREYSETVVQESFVVRAALEETATRLAMTSGLLDFAVLEQEVAGMYDAAKHRDGHSAGERSNAFHRHILTSAGNAVLLRVWEGVVIHAGITIAATHRNLRAVAKEHETMVDGMRAGDIETAARAAREHQLVYAGLASS